MAKQFSNISLVIFLFHFFTISEIIIFKRENMFLIMYKIYATRVTIISRLAIAIAIIPTVTYLFFNT